MLGGGIEVGGRPGGGRPGGGTEKSMSNTFLEYSRLSLVMTAMGAGGAGVEVLGAPSEPPATLGGGTLRLTMGGTRLGTLLVAVPTVEMAEMLVSGLVEMERGIPGMTAPDSSLILRCLVQ